MGDLHPLSSSNSVIVLPCRLPVMAIAPRSPVEFPDLPSPVVDIRQGPEHHLHNFLRGQSPPRNKLRRRERGRTLDRTEAVFFVSPFADRCPRGGEACRVRRFTSSRSAAHRACPISEPDWSAAILPRPLLPHSQSRSLTFQMLDSRQSSPLDDLHYVESRNTPESTRD